MFGAFPGPTRGEYGYAADLNKQHADTNEILVRQIAAAMPEQPRLVGAADLARYGYGVDVGDSRPESSEYRDIRGAGVRGGDIQSQYGPNRPFLKAPLPWGGGATKAELTGEGEVFDPMLNNQSALAYLVRGGTFACPTHGMYDCPYCKKGKNALAALA